MYFTTRFASVGAIKSNNVSGKQSLKGVYFNKDLFFSIENQKWQKTSLDLKIQQ